MSASFTDFFRRALGDDAPEPHSWQLALAADPVCRDRVIRIPTGFGKTAGVVLTWLSHRVARADESWPRRLVFVLPMRVLVEQTHAAVTSWLANLGLADRVPVHLLMGGVEAAPWVADPEREAILIGTQDMLLSRALNRGYGAARGRWPMEMGLLHHDALWVLDEVQLMGVGVTTSAQLAAFREQDGGRFFRPQATWWMSATLRDDWLVTVDSGSVARQAIERTVEIPADAREGALWNIRKTLEYDPTLSSEAALAEKAANAHEPGTTTLIVVNRVARAVEVHHALASQCRKLTSAPELRLVHSRFRPHEREAWASDFLRKKADVPPGGRIIVATQVVEAGVDISARLLITDLAPWASLVQRFGRCARYEGDHGRVIVAGAAPEADKEALPYSSAELAAAARALTSRKLGDVGLRGLAEHQDALEKADPDLVAALFVQEAGATLRRHDFDELFDTSPDLSGADLDVSAFIRLSDERDVRLFWRSVDVEQRNISVDAIGRVLREELCPAPIGDAKTLVDKRGPAWRLDYLEGVWRRCRGNELVPGDTVLLDARAGGYDVALGFDVKAKEPVPVVVREVQPIPPLDKTAEAASDDTLSAAQWKSIAVHGREVADVVRAIATELGLPPWLGFLLELASRWHDAGKAHEVFQGAIKEEARSAAGALGAARDLAKAPSEAWDRKGPKRRGFRHELASMLGILELLRRHAPTHAALRGPHEELLSALGAAPAPAPDVDIQLAREIAALQPDEIDLLLWLVVSHHGKVRCRLVSTPLDEQGDEASIFGVVDGDALPATAITSSGGDAIETPALTLSLDFAAMGLSERYGASWSERVASLLSRHGPFTLAYLEAILRAADWRASAPTYRGNA